MCPEACRTRPVRESVRTSGSSKNDRRRVRTQRVRTAVHRCERFCGPGTDEPARERLRLDRGGPGSRSGKQTQMDEGVPQPDDLSGPKSRSPIELRQGRRKMVCGEPASGPALQAGGVAKPTAARSVSILRYVRAAPEFRLRQKIEQKFGL